MTKTNSSLIRVGLIGAGKVALANHLPGLALLPQAKIVALCDADPNVLEQAKIASGISDCFGTAHEMIAADGIDAVIIATPNHVHREIAVAAARAGKHVLCEKPLALNIADSREMRDVANQQNVRHMTAFTYRFVPSMRYMRHLIADGAIGTPLHFRAWRFQDWGKRSLAWRQRSEFAGTGELGDMMSHRLDYAHFLVGPIVKVVAMTKRILDERADLEGRMVPADVEDWVAMVGTFQNDATAVLESTKMATGRGEGAEGEDLCEVNGTEGTAIYRLGDPLHIQIARKGGKLEREPVPVEWRKVPASPRDLAVGDPRQTFRYDQNVEFIQAIEEGRACEPSFNDGVRVQAVMDAIMQSAREGRAVDVDLSDW